MCRKGNIERDSSGNIDSFKKLRSMFAHCFQLLPLITIVYGVSHLLLLSAFES